MVKKTHVFRLLLIIVASTALLMTACSNKSGKGEATEEKITNDTPIHLSTQVPISTLDPRLIADRSSMEHLNQTNEGLYAYNAEGQLTPAAAADFPKINKERTIYTIPIRKNGIWSNGDPVTAHDFEYSWKSAISPNSGSQLTYMFDGLLKNANAILKNEAKPESLGVKALDDYTLQVTLERPVAYFPRLLPYTIFYPINEKYANKQGDKFGTDAEHILFNGPYIIKDWKQSANSWRYEQNKDYWNKDSVKTANFTFDVVPDSNTGANLFEAKKLDYVELSSDFAKQYKDNKDFVAFPGDTTKFIRFNQKHDVNTSHLDNTDLRLALSLTIDRDMLVNKVLDNGSTVTKGLVPAGFVSNPVTKKDYRKQAPDVVFSNNEAAQEHFTKAKKALAKQTFSIELLVDDSDNSKVVSEFVKEQWEKKLSGVNVEIKRVPAKLRQELDAKGDYQAQLTGWSPNYQDPLTYLEIFKSSYPGESMGYKNEKFDQLINDVETKLYDNETERWKTMVEAEKVAIEESAAVAPLFVNSVTVLKNPELQDYKLHPYTLLALRYMYLGK